jgi:hypothetical protein
MNRPRDRARQQTHTRLERGGEERGAEGRRHWRVFDYRRPTPARPRFTT